MNDSSQTPAKSDPPDYDRKSELKAFDDSKSGVKGLVDAGLSKIPRIFVSHEMCRQWKDCSDSGESHFALPVIDFGGIVGDSIKREETIHRVREASEDWGFFQVVNHGIDECVMDGIMDGVWRFHEQETEVKRGFYSRDQTKKVMYNTNFDFYSAPSANWRDSLYCAVAPDPPLHIIV